MKNVILKMYCIALLCVALCCNGMEPPIVTADDVAQQVLAQLATDAMESNGEEEEAASEWVKKLSPELIGVYWDLIDQDTLTAIGTLTVLPTANNGRHMQGAYLIDKETKRRAQQGKRPTASVLFKNIIVGDGKGKFMQVPYDLVAIPPRMGSGLAGHDLYDAAATATGFNKNDIELVMAGNLVPRFSNITIQALEDAESIIFVIRKLKQENEPVLSEKTVDCKVRKLPQDLFEQFTTTLEQDGRETFSLHMRASFSGGGIYTLAVKCNVDGTCNGQDLYNAAVAVTGWNLDDFRLVIKGKIVIVTDNLTARELLGLNEIEAICVPKIAIK